MPRFAGSCHCGALRFAIDLADDERDVLDCNCSICTKKGFLHLIVDEPRFTLLAGEPAVYTFGTHTAKHMFCGRCGIQPFYRPRSHPDAWDVNARCLDVPLAHWRIRPFDGANWEQNVDSIRQRVSVISLNVCAFGRSGNGGGNVDERQLIAQLVSVEGRWWLP